MKNFQDEEFFEVKGDPEHDDWVEIHGPWGWVRARYCEPLNRWFTERWVFVEHEEAVSAMWEERFSDPRANFKKNTDFRRVE